MPHLVVLHGFLGQPSHWNTVVSEASLPAHSVTLPGHGPTPWTAPNATFDTVTDALLTHPPFDTLRPPYALAGYSLGGRLALSLAVRHPDKISSLFLVSTSPGITDPQARLDRAASDDKLSRLLVSNGLEDFISLWQSLPLFSSQQRLPADLRERHRARRSNHSPTALAWALSTLSPGRMPPLQSFLESLTIPVHLVTGSLDTKYTHLAQHSKHPHTVIPNAGHDVILENPLAVAHCLKTFITNTTKNLG